MSTEVALTAKDIRAQVQLIQEVMKAVMKEGQHYGVVPGCGDKPTLLKPGAEKLLMTFHLACEPEVEDLSESGCVRFRIRARVTNMNTGQFVGTGVGECASSEEKYAWREVVCEEEWDATDASDKRTKWKRKRDGGSYSIQQVRTNPSDVANTILKMAKKRALVDATLTVTAASDIFTQDLEDMPEEVLGGHKAGAASTKKEGDFKPGTMYEGTLTSFRPVNGKKPIQLVVDVGGAELTIGGFDLCGLHSDDIGAAVGKVVQVSYAMNGKYINLSHFAVKPDQETPASDAGQEPEPQPAHKDDRSTDLTSEIQAKRSALGAEKLGKAILAGVDKDFKVPPSGKVPADLQGRYLDALNAGLDKMAESVTK